MVHTGSVSRSTKRFCDILDITEAVADQAARSGIENGSVTTIEYETGGIRDLARTFEAIVPSNVPYEHDRRWGDGNGFSHVRAALLKPSLTVPWVSKRLALGTWQQIVLIDFDNRPRKRELLVQVIGE